MRIVWQRQELSTYSVNSKSHCFLTCALSYAAQIEKKHIGGVEEALAQKLGKLDSSVGFNAHLVRYLRQGD